MRGKRRKEQTHLETKESAQRSLHLQGSKNGLGKERRKNTGKWGLTESKKSNLIASTSARKQHARRKPQGGGQVSSRIGIEQGPSGKSCTHQRPNWKDACLVHGSGIREL